MQFLPVIAYGSNEEWFSIETLQVSPIIEPIAQMEKLTGSKGISDDPLFVEEMFFFLQTETLFC